MRKLASARDHSGRSAVNRQVEAGLSHLQKVHFYLVVTCIALLAAVNLGQHNDATTALNDLNEISDVVNRWDELWLDQGARTALGHQPTMDSQHYASRTYSVRLPFAPTEDPYQMNRPWTLYPLPPNLVSAWAVLGENYPFFGSDCAIPRPDNLREFQRLWDNIETIEVHCVFNVCRKAMLWDVSFPPPDYDSQPKPLTVSCSELPGTPDHAFELALVTPSPEAEQRYQGIGARAEAMMMDDGMYDDDAPPGIVYNHMLYSSASNRPQYGGVAFDLIVPVSTIPVTFSGRAAFNAVYGTEFHTGSFERSFGDLHHITSDYLDSPLDHVARVLESEKRRSPRKFVFFGAEIPSEQVAIFGIPIILMLQIYMYAHARGIPFNGSAIRLSAVSWIGLQNGVVELCLLVASTMVLQPMSVAVVGWQGATSLGPTYRVLITTSVTIASMFLALAILFQIRRLRDAATARYHKR